MRFVASSKTAVLLMLLFFFAATCGWRSAPSFAEGGKTKKRVAVVTPPKWFTHILPDQTNLVARGTSESKDQQVAIDKAALVARSEIAVALSNRWKALVQAIREEGVNAQAPAWESVTLRGSKIKAQTAVKRGKVWTAFVLVSFPTSSIVPLLLEKVQSDPQWYARVKATRVVRQLEYLARQNLEIHPGTD